MSNHNRERSHMAMSPTEESYFRGLRYLPQTQPRAAVIVRNKDGSEDGPCELLIREQEMPPIDGLAEDLAYGLGLAMRFIGYTFDKLGLSPNDALRIFGLLAEAADERMQSYRKGECGPFTVDVLIAVLLRTCGKLYRNADVDVASGIRGYVASAARMPLELVKHPPIADDMRRACANLIERIPAFHLASDVYDQCERADWVGFRLSVQLLPAAAFLIAVDGATWLQLVDDPTKQAQTQWLLVDAREPIWSMYERVKVRGMDVPTGFENLIGATLNFRSGSYQPMESLNTFLPVGGSFEPSRIDTIQAARIAHAVLSFLLLLRNPRVKRRAHRAHGHWTVSLPGGFTVNDLIGEVLDADQSA